MEVFYVNIINLIIDIVILLLARLIQGSRSSLITVTEVLMRIGRNGFLILQLVFSLILILSLLLRWWGEI